MKWTHAPRLAVFALLLAAPAHAAVDTVTITGNVTKPSGSSDSALDPCERCEVTVEFVGTNDLTAESLVITDTPSVFYTDGSGDWTTSPLKLLQGGNYRFRFRDPAWPQAGIFLDVTKTAATCVAPCSATFSSLTTVNVAEGADVSALDHGSLSGLSDDDHTQYVEVAGEAGYSGTHDFSGATVSGIAYGDLSGVPSSFAPASHTIASHSDTTATGAELETLTDGSDAGSLHTHGGLDDWSDDGSTVSAQSGRDVSVGASITLDAGTGTVDAAAYTVSGVALASADLSDGATVTNLGDTIEAAEISDLAAGSDITADLEEETHGSEHGEAGGDPIPLSTFELSDLGDVSASSPSSGQALSWNGSAWAPATVTGSVAALDDLSDAAVTTPSSGQVLVHDGIGDFANVSISGDATLAANGALALASGSVDTAELAAGAVTNTEIAAAAGISLSKIEDSGTAGLFLQSGGGGGDPAYGAIVSGDLPGAVVLETEIDSEAELESVTGLSIFTSGDGALADDDLSDDSINALSDVDTATSSPTSGQVLSWDGVGEWVPAADDDVPESGDFGAGADLESDGSLSADVVGPAELADGDYGDVSFALGVISIDTGAVGTAEIATDGVDSAEIAADAVGASELADDAVDLAALSDADYGDWSVALGSATLDANTVGASEIEATSVTPGSYTFTALTVDADGRITAASSGTDDDSPDSDAEVPDAITVGVGGTVAAAATVSVEAAEISDASAGTDITADLEEETHADEHGNGGADEISVAGLSGQLADAQPVAVHKEGAAATGTRAALNFVDTSPVTVTLADDAGNGWVDVTVACPTCSTDTYALSVQEGDAELTAAGTALDFGAGFDLTETPTGEANIVLDYTEDPVNLSGSEVTGTLPASSVGNGLTDAQVSDAITVGSGGSVAAGALPSNVVYEDGTHTLTGSFDFSGSTVTVAGDEWVDADVSNAITVDNYLPLAGGTVTGNVGASAGVTFDGIDLSAINFTDLSGTASDAQIPDTITIDGSANVSNASLQSEVMRTDTTETVASIHTYTAAPDFSIAGVPFTMGAGITGTVTRLDADLLDGEHASAFADASHAHAGEDITSGTVSDARIASTLTRDSEWDTAAEINAATTDDDFVTETGTHTVSGALTLTGSIDAGGGTAEVPNSTALPGACTVGEIYMDTDATSGQRLYLCESANTWAVQGDGDGGSTTLDVAYDNTGGTGNRVIDLDEGNVKFDLEDATNDYHVAIDNTTTGTMDRGLQVLVSGAGGVITDAVDASDAEIVNALDIGANNITTDAATISSDELEVLDNGLDPADMDDNDWGEFTITSGVTNLDAGVVDPDELADADFGDFTVASGLATLDADVVDSAEIATDAVTASEIATGGVAADEVLDDSLDFSDFVDSMTVDGTALTIAATGIGGAASGSETTGGVDFDMTVQRYGYGVELFQAGGTNNGGGIYHGGTGLYLANDNTANQTIMHQGFKLESVAGTSGGIHTGILVTGDSRDMGVADRQSALHIDGTWPDDGIYLDTADIGLGSGSLNCTACIDATDLGTDSVASDEIAAGAVGASEIQTDAVGTAEIDLSISPTWTGDHDFGGGTLQVPNGINLPGTCEIGDSYMDTDATSGQRWYLCESGNTWVQQGGGSETNDLETDDPPNVQDDEVYVGDGAGSGAWIALADSDGAGQKLTYDTATNTFAAGVDDDTPDDDSEVPDALTIAGGTIGTSSLTLVQGAAPTPTAEGRIEWETDDDHLIVGDGTAAVEFVPAEDVSGDATMDDDGVLSLSADVVAPAEMADADHGDISWSGGAASLDADVVGSAEMADEDHGAVSWSGGVATVEDLACTGCVSGSELADGDLGDVSVSSGSVTIDAGVVGRSEIDETLLSIQSHATDCTALTCDAGSDGELCLEQDDDTVYVCDGSGSPAWSQVGSSSTSFADLTGATNTTAAMVVGTGASLTTSGSGTITATTAAALAANGSNCSAGQAAGGVDDAGAAEDCTTYLQNVVEDTTPQLGGELDAQGQGITDLADVTFRTGVSGGTIRTGTSAADKFILQAYDVDGAAYLDMLELDAGNTPLMSLLHVTEIDMDNGGQIRSGTSAGETLLLQARDVDGASWTTFGTLTSDNTPTFDLGAGTTLGGAAIQTGTDDDVPESGDFGAASDLEADGSLSVDVVAAAEMADADHGDISWSGGVASVDSGVIGRTEIDETLLSVQTHATDCTALTCDAGSDGELCFEQDDDAYYVCDGSGSPAWASIGGGSTGFDGITTGTNTSATMTVGTGASIVASGSGSITATAVAADSVALSTDTTGNYVATVADAGSSRVTVTGSGSEGAGVTLDVSESNLDHGSIGGLTDDDHALYLNTSAADTFSASSWSIYANTSDGSDTYRLDIGAGGANGGDRGATLVMYGEDHATKPGDVSFFTGDSGDMELIAGAGMVITPGTTQPLQIGGSGDIAALGVVGIGSATLASAACIANDGADRLFHDTDCDDTKDSGEEFVDINTRQHEEWIGAGDPRCYHQSSGGATADASDQAATSGHAWGAGYTFPDGSDTTITCRVRIPASFVAASAVEIQLEGHTEGAIAGAGDVDFEVSVLEVGDGESWASAFGSAQGTSAGDLDITVGAFATDVSERTAWFTLTETLAAGDWLSIEIMRDGDDATNDDKSASFRLDDIGIRWTESLE